MGTWYACNVLQYSVKYQTNLRQPGAVGLRETVVLTGRGRVGFGCRKVQSTTVGVPRILQWRGFTGIGFMNFPKWGRARRSLGLKTFSGVQGQKIPVGGHVEIVITKLKQHKISVHILTFSYIV